MSLFKSYFTVKQTTDYDTFKYLEENRDIKSNDSKFKALKESIELKGYLISPVVVSAEGYVIDGQHRIQACRELNIPVLYVVNSMISKIEDVIDANNTQRAWDLMDYIKHWASRGDIPCKDLLSMINEYSEFGDATVADAFCGHSSKKSRSLIKTGDYVIDMRRGHEILTNAQELREVIGLKYKQSKLVRALSTLMKRNDHFNIDHFKNKCYIKKFHIYNNESEIVESMVEVYNYHTKKDKIK